MLKRSFRSLKCFIIPLLLYVIFTALAPGRFGNITSMFIIFQQSLIPTVIGMGMCFGMCAGLFDLSAGAEIILASLLGAFLSLRFGMVGLIAGCIVGGLLVTAVTGTVYYLLRIPSLVVSLGMVMLYEAVASEWAGKTGMLMLPENTVILGTAPYNIMITILACATFYYLFYRTKFSYHVRAVGGNERLAISLGLNARKIKSITYVAGGIFIGIAALMQSCYAGSVGVTMSMASLNSIFQPMMGLIIGLQFRKSINLVFGIFVGELSISIIFTGLIAMGFPGTMQNVSLGMFLIIVMAITNNRSGIDRLFSNFKIRKAAEYQAGSK